jgi:2-methylisocitrate lyase-like PEP mutase family enzyme
MKKTSQLRALIKKSGIIVAPGAYDAISARIIEDAGFKVVNIMCRSILMLYSGALRQV